MVLEWMNLYDLFVNNVFGALWLANLGVGMLLIVIGFLTKQSNSIILAIVLLYAITLTLAWAPIASLIIFVAGFMYMGIEIVRFFTPPS